MDRRGPAPPTRGARGRRLSACLAAGLLLFAGACTQEVEEVPAVYRPTNAHDAYRFGLVQAELGATALGRDWIAAADAALREPITVTAPFRESGYFDSTAATAVGYSFTATTGQRIEAELLIETSEPMRIFMDLFRLVDDDPQAPVHVATGATLIEPPVPASDAPVGAPENVRRLQLAPLRDGTYVLRVQPELLRSARYTVRITVDASLAFPVAGRTMRDAWSAFGAEREGGRRSHRGVDIFAPRGTPVLSASAGIVTRVDTTPVGGNVVWVSAAERNVRLYYAHLDSHSVERGQRVQPGDQLGTVGNTGNAITTPPHLHFGVYARGAVDPDPFLRRLRTEPEDITADADQIGGWSRARDAADLRRGPERRADILGSVALHTPVRVWGASARWYRVTLPDGRSGYLDAGDVEPATPLRSEAVADSLPLLARPASFATVIGELLPGIEVPVLGAFGDFLYVQTPTGRNGWLALN